LNYTGGLQVASNDLDRDGFADILTAPDKGNNVSMYGGAQNGQLISTYNAGAQFSTGVRLSAREGKILLASAAGVAPVVRIVAYQGLVVEETFDPFKDRFPSSPVNSSLTKGQYIG
jgi:hypothetical protein